MRCARSIISKNAQYFHAALKYIYLYRHARPHTHKQPFIKGAKELGIHGQFCIQRNECNPLHLSSFWYTICCICHPEHSAREVYISKIHNFDKNSNHQGVYSTTLPTKAKALLKCSTKPLWH